MEKPENAHYRGWVAQGHLIETPGNMIALRQIEESYQRMRAAREWGCDGGGNALSGTLLQADPDVIASLGDQVDTHPNAVAYAEGFINP